MVEGWIVSLCFRALLLGLLALVLFDHKFPRKGKGKGKGKGFGLMWPGWDWNMMQLGTPSGWFLSTWPLKDMIYQYMA